DARRARLVLMVSDGESYETIQETLACSSAYVARWSARFVQDGLAGLYSRHRGRKPQTLTPRMEATILEWTRRKPADGSTQWSTRRLAKARGVSHRLVARFWAGAVHNPHRMDRYMLWTDREFKEKAADIIGLSLKPPQHAAVFCVDEKTAIQALDRL